MLRFSELNQRILILKYEHSFENPLGETMPKWVPLLPCSPDKIITDVDWYVENGEPYIQNVSDEEYKDAERRYGIWAKVAPKTGREYQEAQKIRSETTYDIKIRYTDSVRTDMKVLFKKRILNIVSILNPYSDNSEINLVCTEVDTNGKD